MKKQLCFSFLFLYVNNVVFCLYLWNGKSVPNFRGFDSQRHENYTVAFSLVLVLNRSIMFAKHFPFHLFILGRGWWGEIWISLNWMQYLKKKKIYRWGRNQIVFFCMCIILLLLNNIFCSLKFSFEDFILPVFYGIFKLLETVFQRYLKCQQSVWLKEMWKSKEYTCFLELRYFFNYVLLFYFKILITQVLSC